MSHFEVNRGICQGDNILSLSFQYCTRISHSQSKKLRHWNMIRIKN